MVKSNLPFLKNFKTTYLGNFTRGQALKRIFSICLLRIPPLRTTLEQLIKHEARNDLATQSDILPRRTTVLCLKDARSHNFLIEISLVETGKLHISRKVPISCQIFSRKINISRKIIS